ncbi:hypothetical protein trd_A0817 (plasmid) [Thermomicrobium roseum DSM 5159]|uniref:Uncharacterized protein n=1 Tax=Thermomicrobium roseum (strain ATCC 27502 / DSM 5159 / P-2) TaxID=309801 RepID=B9L4V3_THERP|nr:hypothetical protein trd_A0817 [Thermomicrobium roseum DSM 5159]
MSSETPDRSVPTERRTELTECSERVYHIGRSIPDASSPDRSPEGAQDDPRALR